MGSSGSALATVGVGLASMPSAKGALQRVKYGRLNDLTRYLSPTREFEVMGTAFGGTGVTAVTAAELPPANRRRTPKEIILERYRGGRAGVPRPDRQQQPAK